VADKKFILFFGAKVDAASLVEMKKKFGATMKGMEESSRKMRDVGAQLSMYVSAPLALIAGLALKTSGDFEEAMITLQAKSGAAGDELEALKEKAKAMGLTTKYSATQSADAMTEFIKAGLTTSDTLAAVESATHLATAAKMNMAEVVTIAADTMAQFSLKATDMTDIADTLAMAADASTTEVKDLSEGLKYAGVVAGASGIDLQETAVVLAALAKSGVKGSMAGTSFASVINGLRAPTREARKAFEELGLAPEMFADSAGNMKMTLKEALTTLKNAGITATQMNKIFEKTGGNAFSGIMKDLGILDEYEDAMAKRSGYAAGQSAKGMEGFNSALLMLKNTFDAFMIAIGDAGLLEWGTKAIKMAQGFLKYLAEINPVFLRLITIMGGVAIGIISIVAALGLVGGALAMVKLGTISLIPHMIRLAASAIVAFAPFFAIALGILAAAALIYLIVDDIWAYVEGRPSLMGAIVEGLPAALKWCKDKFFQFTSWMGDLFSSAFKSVWEGIKNMPLIKTFIKIYDLISAKEEPGATGGGALPSVSTPIGQMSSMRNSQTANQTLNVNPVIDIVVNGNMGGDPKSIGNTIGEAIAGHVRSAADSLKPAYAQ
jgi:TP901 family phage tail tape measure protein